MLAAITTGANPYVPVTHGDQVCVLLNNLGGTPTMELYICARRAIAQLRATGASVVRAFVWAVSVASVLSDHPVTTD
eukprot:m.377533 g.377533  ORF g.377533 m.377533 type:complete len:77 (-) comp28206_c0_seq3:1195-1425(-)